MRTRQQAFIQPCIKLQNIRLRFINIVALLLSVIFFTSACDVSFPSITETPIPAAPTSTQLGLPSSTKTTPASASTTPPIPTSQLDVSADALRGKIVRFWHPWTGMPGKTIQLLTEEFNLTNPWGILVTQVAHPGYDEMANAFKADLNTPEAPQIAVGLSHQIFSWDSIQDLVDLQVYFSDPEWGLSSADQEDLIPIFWNQDVSDNRRLGLPAFRSAHMLFYNQTWGKELGFLLPPQTPEQFRQQVCAATLANRQDDTPDNDNTGGWFVSTEYLTLLSWVYTFGGEPVKSPLPGSDQSIYQFNTPETEEALIFLRELYDAGCAWHSESQTSEEVFRNRLSLVTVGSLLDIPYQSEALKKHGRNDQWTVLPFLAYASQPVLIVYGPSYFIVPSSPEQQLAAWLFIRWLSAPENNVRLAGSIGGFPVRTSALEQLKSTYQNTYPQWVSAADLLQYGRSEPAFASWLDVRRALGDAATQLFRSYFTIEQIPAMLDYLDVFAAELHLGPNLQDIFATPTLTAKPGARPTRTPKPTAPPSATTLP